MNDRLQVHAAPTSPPPDVPAGKVAVWDETKQQWNVVSAVDVGSVYAQGSILEKISVTEFLDLFFPIKAKILEVGDRVFNRSTKRFGHIIRATQGSFRVETDGKIGTYWEQELEPR